MRAVILGELPTPSIRQTTTTISSIRLEKWRAQSHALSLLMASVCLMVVNWQSEPHMQFYVMTNNSFLDLVS